MADTTNPDQSEPLAIESHVSSSETRPHSDSFFSVRVIKMKRKGPDDLKGYLLAICKPVLSKNHIQTY
jgi:hypothetical protein